MPTRTRCFGIFLFLLGVVRIASADSILTDWHAFAAVHSGASDYEATVFDETIVLDDGDYSIVLALDVVSYVENPVGDCAHGAATATLSASVTTTIGMEDSGWGRIKAI